jgi:hypothetical protein
MPCILVLLMLIDVLVVSVGCFYLSFYIQRGQDYKKDNRVDYNMISIRNLFLLVYYIYIFINIIFYTLVAHHSLLKSSGWWTES